MNQEKLVLTGAQVSNLMEAVSVHLSHKAEYRKASINGKVIKLTAQLLTARKLLEIQHEIGDLSKTVLDKQYFKEFMQNVENSYLLQAYTTKTESVSFAFHATGVYKGGAEAEEWKFFHYVMSSDVVQKLKEVEDFKEDLFDANLYEKEVFNLLQTEFDFGIKSRSALGFYKEPSKYIHSSKFAELKDEVLAKFQKDIDENRMKMIILCLHIGVAFIPNKDDLKEYIKSLRPDTKPDVSEEIISKLHGFSISKKAIYNHRLAEIANIMKVFITKDRFGYDTVLKSVVQSIVFCKQNRIHSFLEVTNLIINNLLVEAFNNRKMKSQVELEMNTILTYADSMNPNVVLLVNKISDYVDTYYKNKHERACAYSIGAAMKQAMAFMSKREPDLFYNKGAK